MHGDRRDLLPLNTRAIPSLPRYSTAGGPPPEGFPILAQMKEFRAVYKSYDPQLLLEQWLAKMPNLQILHVRCTHDGPDPETGIWYDPYSRSVATNLVESLTNYLAYTHRLRWMYLDDVFFKPNELLQLVQKRQKLNCPLEKIQVRTSVMAASECAALHKLVDFEHILTHAKYGKLDEPGCACRCECEGPCVIPDDRALGVKKKARKPTAPLGTDLMSPEMYMVSLCHDLESSAGFDIEWSSCSYWSQQWNTFGRKT